MSTAIQKDCVCRQSHGALPPPVLEEIRSTSVELHQSVHALVQEINEGLRQSAAGGARPACAVVQRNLAPWVRDQVVGVFRDSYSVSTLSRGYWRSQCDTVEGIVVQERT